MRCSLCFRLLGEHDADWRLVGVERVCDVCFDRGDEYVDIPLDYTEDVASQ